MGRNTARAKVLREDKTMDSFFAAMAMSAFAMGSGAPGTPARAAIPPQDVVADRVMTYRIPAGSMASALTSFADKNGLHILYDARATQHVRSAGLLGRHSLRGGLDRLLKGTGITYEFTPVDGTIAIRLAQARKGTQSDANPVALPSINVEGAEGFGGAGPAQDPYNTTYELKDATTGTKTDTPIMDTPVNVQVIPQQVLRDQQAITLEEALRNVSGVFVVNGVAADTLGSRSGGIIIRGFRADTFYRDGFRFDNTSFDNAGTRQLANIASIEVLKGPGAMLYGLVEPGGVVNLVTKEPLNAPYYSVQQQIGSLALYRTTLDATGPVTDDKSWLYRINLSYENNGAPFGSFIDLTHSQNIFVAPVVKWNIDPSTWVKLEAEYSEDRLGGYVPYTSFLNRAFVIQPRNRNYGEWTPDNQTALFTALTWSHHFDKDWSIKQQIAYSDLTRHFNPTLPTGGVLSTTAGPAVRRFRARIETASKIYSTNVDITGHIDTFGVKHTLLLGGDVYRTTLDGKSSYRAAEGSIIDFWNPVHPGTPFPFFDISNVRDNAQNTAGLYLQDQIELPYHVFLLAGARYQYIRQQSASGSTASLLSPTGRPLEAQAVTPRYGLLWRPQEWVSFYGSYTEGFGPNRGTIFPGILAPPSNAKSWEAGIKLELFDGRLRATADYYDLTKTNIPTADPLNPGFSLLVGAARSKGVELDIQGEILPGWNVIASYANQDVRITKINPNDRSSLVGTEPGQRYPLVPRNIASLWTTYEFQDETLKGLKIGGGYTYTGSQPVLDYLANPAGTFPLLPSYGLVDLMAAYSFKLADAKVTAQLNISNLFNKTYFSSASVASLLTPAPGLQGRGDLSYGAPFAVLGSIRAEF